MKKLVCLLLVASFTTSAHAADKHKASNVDAQFEQLFSNVDSDHNGKISQSEAELKAPAMADAFEQIDTDRDAQLSKQEIKNYTAAMLKSREEFTRHLDAADKDKNGKLSKEESKALPKLYENFDAIDSDHDGQLVIKEISDYLRAQFEAQKTASR